MNSYSNRAAFLSAMTFLVVAATTSAASAQSGDDRQWQYYQFNDDLNGGRTVSILVFGIPETDAVAVSGICTAGSSGTFSKVTFGIDVTGFEPGKAVEVNFKAGDFNSSRSAHITSENFEEGVSGIELVIDNDDALWKSMQKASQIEYSIANRSNTLDLKGSFRPISNFLADCRHYSGSGIEQHDDPAPVSTRDPDNEENRLPDSADPRRDLCDHPQYQQSVKSDFPVTLTFRNMSGAYRSVMWVGFDGMPVSYADLDPGEEFTINTYLTHPWMFTDGPGNCMEKFMPQLGVSHFNITAPNP
ncbi:MAG: hypothetical protein JJ891_12540 [Rhizobiaceae bacterium]|nr:hypothetical protein [Rhizobiaceae bacterium]